MKLQQRYRVIIVFLSMAWFPSTQPILAAPSPQTTGDENWDIAFTLPGAYSFPEGNGTGTVVVSIIDNSNNLYIGGSFDAAGGVLARHVAKYDGVRWSALAGGLDFQVNALITDSSGNLYAAGQYTGDQATDPAPIMRWNGTSWQKIGEVDFTNPSAGAAVYALEMDGNGILYAGGKFDKINATGTNSQLLRWDGVSWTEIGGEQGAVYTLEADALNDLYVGGSLLVPASGDHADIWWLARWSKGNWIDIGYRGVRNVKDLEFSSTGSLFVIGYEDDSVAHLYERKITTWSELGFFQTVAVAEKIAAGLAADSQGNTYLAGAFNSFAGVAAYSVVRWDGSTWSALGSGLLRADSLTAQGEVYTAVVDRRDRLYLGGNFVRAGSANVANLARWDGSRWSGVGPAGSGGLLGHALAVAPDSSGNLYAGGNFIYTEVLSHAPALNYVARWDGSAWQPLGNGMNNLVRALAVDRAGNLYAGGEFTQAGGQPAAYIARWNGQSWSPLGSGLSGSAGSLVHALAVDQAGNLYAGGDFDYAGGVRVDGLARWNGTAWQSVPGWCVTPPSGGCGITALAFDRSGKLYLGGLFYLGGWRQVAMWDGTSFQAITGNPISDIHAIAADGNRTVYIGGYNGSQNSNVAAWDTISGNWSTPGGGIWNGNGVDALAVDASNYLYAGGYFNTAGGGNIPNLARWNGTSWSALGSGISSQVYAFASQGNKLYLGMGYASAKAKAGGMGVVAVARWSFLAAPALYVNYGSGRPGSYFTIGGTGFPANAGTTMTVNGYLLSSALTTDASGGLTFRLYTSEASPGFYLLTVRVNTSSASVQFTIDSNAPLQTQEGSGVVFNVPAGIAAKAIYLPQVRK